MESSLPIQPSHPAAEPDARWYRLALLLTGDAAAAEEILRAVFAVASNELPHLRSKERRMGWMIRQMRARALKWHQAHRAEPVAPAGLPSRVARLPEPSRSVFALFHCLDGSLDDVAETLGLRRAAFAQALAGARRELAPDGAFPENGLLPLHRPWGGDEPKVAKAVCAASSNPQLAAQIAADLQWHEEIGQMEVPEELALLHLSEPLKMGLRALVFQPTVLAIALALAVVAGVLVYVAKTRMDDFPGKEAVIALVDAEGARTKPEFAELKTPTEAGKLGDWFVLNGFEGYAAPKKLQKAKVIGARVFKQDNVSMAEVVLEQQSARMLIFRAADLKNGIEKPRRHIFQQEGWAVAAWNEQETSYVVMLNGDRSDMPDFLRTVGH
ncbi:MAG: hypothetical protein WCO68_06765 [Verrucomicrobiota bacterium]